MLLATSIWRLGPDVVVQTFRVGGISMGQQLTEQFDQIIPNAASKAEQFLGVIQKTTVDSGIPLSFVAEKARKTGRVCLVGTIQVGSTFRKTRPMKMEVYADAMGNSLQVGWQLSKAQLSGFAATFDSNVAAAAWQDLRDMHPDNIRQVNGILSAFHETVFLPVMGFLVDAVGRPSDPQSGGFLNA
jgi:hypothetical protein